MSASLTRRGALAGAVATLSLAAPRLARGAAAKILVVGGGFAGATCAKYLKRADPALEVMLLDKAAQHVSCVGSNEVLVGLRTLGSLKKGFGVLGSTYGVVPRMGAAKSINATARTVRLADGTRLGYDRLVLAPGIEFRNDAIPGWTTATTAMPHAWIAGAQTTTLQNQLKAMPNKGTVIISVPPAPYRCPPAPYERASLIAWYLKRNKGGGRIVILDANETMPKQALFLEAWQALYPGMIQWVKGSEGGQVLSVNATTRTVETAFDTWRGDVVNIIAPHRAPALLRNAGLADSATGWCPVDPVTFASTKAASIHVIGDSCTATPLPKSGTSGNAEAKVCASAIARHLAGKGPDDPLFINTCYSTIQPDYAIGLAGVYRVQNGAVVTAAFGTSPTGASRDYRHKEADDAIGWMRSFFADTFA